VYDEGLHVDVFRTGELQDVTLWPDHPPLSRNLGRVIRRCTAYLDQHSQYLVQVRRGDISPRDPPRF
jgi:hypothetical protein